MQIPGEGTGTGAGTYRSQGAPSPRCCHRAWCARSGPRAGPGARCGAPTKICCWGSQIPPARCHSSCAGRGPAGPEPGWLQRTSLGDEVTAGKREAVASPTEQMQAKGGVIQPEPIISPQSHPDTLSTRLHPSQEPPITCREHTSRGPWAPPTHHSLHRSVPASSVTQMSPPMAGRLWKGPSSAQPPESLSPPFTGCSHPAGPQPNPKALRGQGHPKASPMASLPSTEPRRHPPCPASP